MRLKDAMHADMFVISPPPFFQTYSVDMILNSVIIGNVDILRNIAAVATYSPKTHTLIHVGI